jgi:hypothetical protein
MFIFNDPSTSVESFPLPTVDDPADVESTPLSVDPMVPKESFFFAKLGWGVCLVTSMVTGGSKNNYNKNLSHFF